MWRTKSKCKFTQEMFYLQPCAKMESLGSAFPELLREWWSMHFTLSSGNTCKLHMYFGEILEFELTFILKNMLINYCCTAGTSDLVSKVKSSNMFCSFFDIENPFQFCCNHFLMSSCHPTVTHSCRRAAALILTRLHFIIAADHPDSSSALRTLAPSKGFWPRGTRAGRKF